jgi:hypothetical protein
MIVCLRQPVKIINIKNEALQNQSYYGTLQKWQFHGNPTYTLANM